MEVGWAWASCILQRDFTLGFLRDSKDMPRHTQPTELPRAGLMSKKCKIGKIVSLPWCLKFDNYTGVTSENLDPSSPVSLWALQCWKQAASTASAIFSTASSPPIQSTGGTGTIQTQPDVPLTDALWWTESLRIYTSIRTLPLTFL